MWALAFLPEGNCFCSLNTVFILKWIHSTAQYNLISCFDCGDRCFSSPAWHPAVRYKPVLLQACFYNSTLLFLSNNKA